MIDLHFRHTVNLDIKRRILRRTQDYIVAKGYWYSVAPCFRRHRVGWFYLTWLKLRKSVILIWCRVTKDNNIIFTGRLLLEVNKSNQSLWLVLFDLGSIHVNSWSCILKWINLIFIASDYWTVRGRVPYRILHN